MGSNCCRHIVGTKRNVASPFGRLVVFGYYDGPTDGVAECSKCKAAYRFELLDWDEGQDLRVFSLAPLEMSIDEFERLTQLTPTWPVWVLIRDDVSSAQEAVDAAIATMSSIEFVISTYDLLATIIDWRPAGLAKEKDWFAALERSRKSALP